MLRWPTSDDVWAAVRAWSYEQKQIHSSLERVGVLGSYGRGTAGVGSDLDMLLVDTAAEGPQMERLILWPMEQLPLSCDALVLTPAELHQLLAGSSRMATELKRDLRWVE